MNVACEGIVKTPILKVETREEKIAPRPMVRSTARIFALMEVRDEPAERTTP